MQRECKVKFITYDAELGETSDIINLYDHTSLSRLIEKTRWSGRYTIAPYSGVEYQGEPLFLGDTVVLNGETLVVACDKSGYYLEKTVKVDFKNLDEGTRDTSESVTALSERSLPESRVTLACDSDERPIPGYLGYFVTSSGEVRSVRQFGKKTLRPAKLPGRDYWYVRLRLNNKYSTQRVDFLVALAFIDSTLKRSRDIVHKNGDLNDNSVGNLTIKG